jgi:hypothetical protein
MVILVTIATLEKNLVANSSGSDNIIQKDEKEKSAVSTHPPPDPKNST